jgi:hypothetical protein
MTSVRSTIISEMEKVALEHTKQLAPLQDQLPLLDSGLDSLSFAILVARLEDTLGYDPFTVSDEVYYPTTLGDFIEFYDRFRPSAEPRT